MIEWFMADSGMANWVVLFLMGIIGACFLISKAIARESIERLQMAAIYYDMAADMFSMEEDDERI